MSRSVVPRALGSIPRYPRRRLTSSALLSAALVAGALGAPTAAQAAGPVQATHLIKVGTQPGSRTFSTPVAGLGDVNGDGRDDFAVSVVTAEGVQSVVRVMFGSPTHTYPTLDNIGSAGFTIKSPKANISAGNVAPIRDFDGDGLTDMILTSGEGLFIVYGARSGADVDLVAGGPRVTKIGAGTVGDDPSSIGDFNGDGFDDFLLREMQASDGTWSNSAVFLGGPRVAALPSTGSRVMTITGDEICGRNPYPPFQISCGYRSATVLPIGDFDGDGREDLFLRQGGDQSSSGTTPVRWMIILGRTTPGQRFVPNYPTGAYIKVEPQVPAWYPAAIDLPTNDAPGYDYDGDGRDDLWVRQGGGEGVLSGFVPGRAGRVAIPLTAAAVTRRSEADFDGPWAAVDGGLASGPQIGDLDGDGDAEGLGLWSQYTADAPGSTDHSAPRGALVLLTDGPDRLAPILFPRIPSIDVNEKPLDINPSSFRPGRNATSIVAGNYESGVPLTLVWKNAAGQVVGTEQAPSKVERVWDGFLDGRELPAGKYTLEVSATDAAGNRSATHSVPFEVLPGGVPVNPPGQTVGPFSGAWKTYGAAKKLSDGSVELTSAAKTVHGEVYWPTPIKFEGYSPETATTVEFDTEITGGSPAGGGLTLAFTAAPPGAAAGGVEPGTGSSLGFAPQKGFAFALQTYKASSTDPSANFMGFTDGRKGNTFALKWWGTANLPTSLRSRTVHVKVEFRWGGGSRAWVDGVQVASPGAGPTEYETVSGPAGTPVIRKLPAYLQFTASTGPGQNQRHVVKNVTMSQAELPMG